MPVVDPTKWAVVIPSFNHADDAITCIESLWAAEPRPGAVLLVDDASTDDAVERLARWADGREIPRRLTPAMELRECPQDSNWLTIVQAETNCGFVATCNTGLEYIRDSTDFSHVLLLNNDAAVAKSYFADLAAALEQVPGAAVVGGSIYEWDRKTVWYAGAQFNPLRALGGHNTKLPADELPRETGYVCGCSMLISRDALNRIGVLADCYRPCYLEDVDYSLRVRSAGYKVIYAPRATCYHRVGSSLGRTDQSPETVFSVTRNRAFTVRRNYRGWRRAAGITYMVVTKPGRALWELANGRPLKAKAVLTGAIVGLFGAAAHTTA